MAALTMLLVRGLALLAVARAEHVPGHSEAMDIKRCPLGYYDKDSCRKCVTFPLLDEIDCADCSNSSVLADIDNDKMREGAYCDGTHLAMYCEPGQYCPNPGVMLPCDLYHYCPKGSNKPIECAFSHTCDREGVAKPSNRAGALVLFLLMIGGFSVVHRITQSRLDQINKRRADQFGAAAESYKAREREIFLMVKYAQRWRARVLGDKALQRRLRARYWTCETEKVLLSALARHTLNRQEVRALRQPIQAFSAEAMGNQSFEIEFRQLDLKLPNGSKILSGISGTIKRGQTTALMGPSGAGKSSLLNVLRGAASSYGTVSGGLFLNGVSVPDLAPFKRVSGFVPQLDTMYEDLTCEENILFSALLFNRKVRNALEAQPLVDEILTVLDLVHIRDSVVGGALVRGVSGGQRKRVSVGMELVIQPVLLFLDEPTSGLDSTTSVNLCTSLRHIANCGVTIVATIHQPRVEIFHAFNDLILMAPGGRMVYCGPVEHVEPYFASIRYTCPLRSNVADFVMDVVSGAVRADGGGPIGEVPDVQRNLVYRWAAKRLRPVPNETAGARDALDAARELPDYAKALRDAKIVMWRLLLRTVRAKRAVILDWMQMFFVGGLIAVLFGSLEPDSSSFSAQISAATLTVGLVGASMGLRLFGSSKDIYARESASGIAIWSYVLGSVLGQLPYVALTPISFLFGYYFLLQPLGTFSGYYFALLLTQWACSGVGALIGLACDASSASTVSTAVNVVFWICNGVAPQPHEDLVANLNFVGVVFHGLSYSTYFARAIVAVEAIEWTPVFEDFQRLAFKKFGLTGGLRSKRSDFRRGPFLVYSESCVALFFHGLITRLLCLAYLGYRQHGLAGLRPLAREALLYSPRLAGAVRWLSPRMHEYITVIPEAPEADLTLRGIALAHKSLRHLRGRTGLQSNGAGAEVESSDPAPPETPPPPPEPAPAPPRANTSEQFFEDPWNMFCPPKDEDPPPAAQAASEEPLASATAAERAAVAADGAV